MKIVKQTLSMNCDVYLSGPHGRNYLNMDIFNEKGVQVLFQDTQKLYDLYPQSILSMISEFGIVKVLGILRNKEI